MYRNPICLFLLVVLLHPQFSLAQTGYKWLTAGGSPDFVEFAIDIDVDEEGMIYVSGEFADGAFLWDSTYSASGDNDMFVGKFDPHGQVQWLNTFGSSQLDRIYGMDVGPDGSVFATGYGKISFNRPPQSAPRHARDIIIVRFDNQGNLVWGKALDGDIFSEGTDIAGNDLGECYMSSRMETVSYFDNDTLIGNGAEDGMLVKFGASGDMIWALAMGGTGDDEFYDMGLDGQEDVVAGGYYTGNASFGGQSLVGVDGEDACLVKVDSSGTVLWAKSFTGMGDEKVTSVTCAEDGSIYFTGNYDGTISLGSFNFTAVNSQDIFYAKADANGNVIWAKTAGANSLDFVEDIEVDQRENVYLCGFYFGNFTIENTTVTSGGADDFFFAKLDSTGNLILFETDHYFDTRDAFGIGVDAQENIVISGAYIGDLILGNDSVSSTNNSLDQYIFKYATLAPDVFIDSVVGLGNCVDSAFTVYYRTQGYFEANNTFSCELSSPSGSFTSPTVLGTTTAVGGEFSVVIPAPVVNGSGYRVRISASNPVINSPDNGSDLTIQAQLSPPMVLGPDTTVCNGSTALPTIPSAYASQIWSTGAITPFAAIMVPGSYSVTATDTNGCTQTISFQVTECVGIEPALDDAFNLYPNPGNGQFYLSSKASIFEPVTLVVYDLQGRTVLMKQEEPHGGNWLSEINLNGRSPGIYLLTATQNGKTWTAKLLLQP